MTQYFKSREEKDTKIVDRCLSIIDSEINKLTDNQIKILVKPLNDKVSSLIEYENYSRAKEKIEN